MTIDEAKEREAFEIHATTRLLHVPKRPDGEYASSVTQEALEAWLARAAQPVSVSREALENALLTVADPDEKHLTREVADMFTPVLRALNIEVDK